MMEVLKKVSKKLSVLLAAAMVVTSISIPSTAVEVKAAEGPTVSLVDSKTGAPLTNCGVDFHAGHGQIVSVNFTTNEEPAANEKIEYSVASFDSEADAQKAVPKNGDISDTFTKMVSTNIANKYQAPLAEVSDSTETNKVIAVAQTVKTYSDVSCNDDQLQSTVNDIVAFASVTYAAEKPEAPTLGLHNKSANDDGIFVLENDEDVVLTTTADDTYYSTTQSVSASIVSEDKVVTTSKPATVEITNDSKQNNYTIWAVKKVGDEIPVYSDVVSLNLIKKAKQSTKPEIKFLVDGNTKSVKKVEHGASVSANVSAEAGDVFLYEYTGNEEEEINAEYIAKNSISNNSVSLVYDIDASKEAGKVTKKFYAVARTGKEGNYLYSEIAVNSFEIAPYVPYVYGDAKLELDKDGDFYSVRPGNTYVISANSASCACGKSSHRIYSEFAAETKGSTLRTNKLVVDAKDCGNEIVANVTVDGYDVDPIVFAVEEGKTITVMDQDSTADNKGKYSHNFTVSVNGVDLPMPADKTSAEKMIFADELVNQVEIFAKDGCLIKNVMVDGESLLLVDTNNAFYASYIYPGKLKSDSTITVLTVKAEDVKNAQPTYVATRNIKVGDTTKTVEFTSGTFSPIGETARFYAVSSNGLISDEVKFEFDDNTGIKSTIVGQNDGSYLFTADVADAGKQLTIVAKYKGSKVKTYTIKLDSLFTTVDVKLDGAVMGQKFTQDIGDAKKTYELEPADGAGDIKYDSASSKPNGISVSFNNTGKATKMYVEVPTTVKPGTVATIAFSNVSAPKNIYKIEIQAVSPAWTSFVPVVKNDTVRTGANQIALTATLKNKPADADKANYYWVAEAKPASGTTKYATAKLGDPITIKGTVASTAYTVNVSLYKFTTAPDVSLSTKPNVTGLLSTSPVSVSVTTLSNFKTEKLSLKKINTNVPDAIGTRTSEMAIASVVTDKNSGYRNDDAYSVVIRNTYGDNVNGITGKISDGKVVLTVNNKVGNGKYYAYVINNVDNSATDKNAKSVNDADIVASTAFNIVTPIYDVSLGDNVSLFKQAGKELKYKVNVTYNTPKTQPKYKKVKYEIDYYEATKEDGTTDNNLSELKNAVTVDAKGNVKVDKAFAGKEGYKKQFIVGIKVTADDYVKNNACTKRINLFINLDVPTIGSIAVVEGAKNVPVANNEITINKPEATDYKVIALVPGARINPTTKGYNVKDIIDPSYYNISTSTKGIVVNRDKVEAISLVKSATIKVTPANKKGAKSIKIKSKYATLDTSKLALYFYTNLEGNKIEKNYSGALTKTDHINVFATYDGAGILGTTAYDAKIVTKGLKKLYDGSYAMSSSKATISLVSRTDSKKVYKVLTIDNAKLAKAPKMTYTKSLIAAPTKFSGNVIKFTVTNAPATATKIKLVPVNDDNHIFNAFKYKTYPLVAQADGTKVATFDVSDYPIAVKSHKTAVTYVDAAGKNVCQSQIVTVTSKRMKYGLKLSNKVVFDKDATSVVLAPKYDANNVESVEYSVYNAFKKNTGSYNTFKSAFEVEAKTGKLSIKNKKSFADVAAENLTGVVRCTVTYKDGAVREYDTTVKLSMKKK